MRKSNQNPNPDPPNPTSTPTPTSTSTKLELGTTSASACYDLFMTCSWGFHDLFMRVLILLQMFTYFRFEHYFIIAFYKLFTTLAIKYLFWKYLNHFKSDFDGVKTKLVFSLRSN